jgi:hypothetical protein
MPFLLTNLRPRLIRRFGTEIVARLFVANPARAFAWV